MGGEIIQRCIDDDCLHIEGGKCKVYLYPERKWREPGHPLGERCPMAPTLIKDKKTGKMINPLKASKRSHRGK